MLGQHECLTLKYLIRHIKSINSSYTGVRGKETGNVSKYYRKNIFQHKQFKQLILISKFKQLELSAN